MNSTRISLKQNLKKNILQIRALPFLYRVWLNRELHYRPFYKVPLLWMKNYSLKYQIIDLEGAKKYKTSDTIFILGSGPSLNNLQKKHLDEIRQHDSFGINYSFLYDLVPTFHSLEDGRIKPAREFMEETFRPHRRKCSKTVWCISDKHLSRFIHPRITPEFFPEEPVCYTYKFPNSIRLNEKRPFRDEDFSESVIYRGSMSVVLQLVLELGYKNIVLLGVDLDKPGYFYDNMPEMKRYVEANYFYENMPEMKWYMDKLDKRRKQKDATEDLKYVFMTPKGNKFNPFDEYLYALEEYLLRKRDVKLFIGFKDNMLYPKIPAYFE